MRGRKTAVIATLLVVSSANSWGAVANAAKAGSGGHKPATPAWTTGSSVVTQCPGAQTCSATGTESVTTSTSGLPLGSLASQAAVARTAPYSGSDEASHLDDVALTFTLTTPVRAVTAAIHFTGIALGSDFGAESPDGHGTAYTAVGAEVVDAACTPRNCGSTTSRVDSYASFADQLAGVDVPDVGVSVDTSSSRSIQVTLSKPDGSDLPAGAITIFAFTEAGVALTNLGCGGDTQALCASGAPHTGRGAASIGATVDSITYSVS